MRKFKEDKEKNFINEVKEFSRELTQLLIKIDEPLIVELEKEGNFDEAAELREIQDERKKKILESYQD